MLFLILSNHTSDALLRCQSIQTVEIERPIVPSVSYFFQLCGSYSETLNNEYIERIHQMSYSSLSDNRMLKTFIFLIK